MQALLEKIHKERGWDFRDYKKTSLSRRISKRLAALDIRSYRDYMSHLDSDRAEYDRLFSGITIKVSEFFREPEVFEKLCAMLTPEFAGAKGLKAWCCGCAYGEEAYSLAITLSECFGKEFLHNTKVYATDIDNDALDFARKGIYRVDSLRNLSPGILERYFAREGDYYRIDYGARGLIKFGTLDIVRNPSLSGINVLFCRNLFIYFDKALQEKVFGKLDYSLRKGGILVLGKAEVLPAAFAQGYEPIGKKLNIFRKL